MRKQADDPDPVIALLTSDWHLSHRKPVCRHPEEDWYAVMRGYLKQVTDKLPSWEVPIIVAGDVLDSYNQPPELVNFLIDQMPCIRAVPGQHDLDKHNLKDIHRSAYATLVLADKIQPITQDRFDVGGERNFLALYGFPWGVDILPPDPNDGATIKLAVIHAYCWSKGHNPALGEADSHFNRWGTKLDGYTHALFGDNHIGWMSRSNGMVRLINSGCLIRRNRGEINYQPSVWLLCKSGRVELSPLDTSGDRFVDMEPVARAAGMDGERLEEFLTELIKLGDKGLDFTEAMRAFLDKHAVRKSVRNFVLEALERK